MSVLTTSQLTFCDLKEAYSIHIDNECIGLACDVDGTVLDAQEIIINYWALIGNDRITLQCDVVELPEGVSVPLEGGITGATAEKNGTIKFVLGKGATLGGTQSASAKIRFSITSEGSSTEDEDQLSFDRYITFVKCMTGQSGASVQIKYLNSKTVPTITNNDVSAWSDTIPAIESGKKLYMTQKLSTSDKWSTPVQMSATDGTTPTVTIVNGYWYVNGESTNVKAEGKDGTTPKVTVGINGNWYIDGKDSGTKAQGENGADGANIEYVYYRSETAQNDLAKPTYTNNTLSTGWTQSPQGITETIKYEYMSVRHKPSGKNTSWGEFSDPVLWAKWGDKGNDGAGVEYKYYLSNSSTPPSSYTEGTSGWTDEPSGVTSTKQYEYAVQIKNGNPSKPALWSKYGVDGAGFHRVITALRSFSRDAWDGYTLFGKEVRWDYRSTDKETSNYAVNSHIKVGDTAYVVGKITDQNNVSCMAYGTVVAIDTNDNGGVTLKMTSFIVDGADGTDGISMNIYSTQGRMFKDDVPEITLKVAAFKGVTEISGATYQWQYWDKTQDGYTNITGATTDSLTISRTDSYALVSLKCIMTYNGKPYEAYETLMDETAIYSAQVRFFNGSNIFQAEDQYLVAYVNLYKNNELIDTPITADLADDYYTGIVDVTEADADGERLIDVSLPDQYDSITRLYFICNKRMADEKRAYEVVLAEHVPPTNENVPSTTWKVVNTSNTEYQYLNTLYDGINSNIIAIPRERINKSQLIDFVVEHTGRNTQIAQTSVNIIDTNDPFIGDDAPFPAVKNQLWLDTSVTPSVLKTCNEVNEDKTGVWVACTERAGSRIFTSQPNEPYKAGDLWILADGETCNGFNAGSMLKATEDSDAFKESHWIDADAENTQMKENIKQHFSFDKDNGLRIGQTDNKFYVNIDATNMGFWSTDDAGKSSEVVKIGIDSATIQNATFKGNATFEDNATFDKDVTVKGSTTFTQEISIHKQGENKGFVWQIEEDGSLSLAIV